MSRPGMKDKHRGGPPRVLGDVLHSFLRQRGLLEKMRDHQLMLDWDEVVGPTIAREARPLKIERGILWIGVNNAPQANHLLYLKPQLLKRIKELYPESKIRGLRILHRPMQGRID